MEQENNIDWQKIFNAYCYYERCGFKNLNVDWTVESKYSNVTKPEEVDALKLKDLDLVGSAEQSFIKLMDNGMLKPETKIMALTPCFRNEPTLDILHRQYFMKLELIYLFETPHDPMLGHISRQLLYEMVEICMNFFSQYLPVEVISPRDFEYDIVEMKTGIELGSYGIRDWNGHEWFYGTGVAEPRLSSVIEIVR